MGIVRRLGAWGETMMEVAVVVAGVLMPPPEFEHPPEVRVIVRHLPAAHIDRVCRLYPELAGNHDGEFGACANPGKDVCTITLRYPGSVSPERYAALARHELAHCNGWRHD
jgi:hypothetical protein